MKVLFLASLLLAGTLAGQAQKKDVAQRTPKKYTIAQFYKNNSVGGGSISADDQRMLINSNESGIFNAYEVDLATGKKKALTKSTKESVFGIDYVPGTRSVIYSSDKGGNEISHLYLLGEDGTVKDLTPGEKEKASFQDWSRDKKYLFYTSNKRDPRYFDLYKMDVASWSPQLVYQNDSGYSIGPISPDERYLTLIQSITTNANKMFVYDQQTKQQKKVNLVTGPTLTYPAYFTLDSQSLVYTSDEGGEFRHVLSYNLATGQKEQLYETNWDVMFVTRSYNGKYRIVGVNEDGYNRLYLFDNATGQPLDFPQPKEGDVKSAGFSRSENKMTLYIGDSKTPNNLYVYDMATQKLKQLTNTLNPEINPADLVQAEVVRYRSFDSLEIPAILYKPQQASATSKVPAIVLVHGGPGGQARVNYSSLIQFLVNNGYAVLDVNNRGSSGYGKTFFNMDNKNHGDKDLKDVVWGKKHLTTLPYVDAGKIGIMGGSYGGYMTLAALAFHPDEFSAGVDIFGVANWVRTLRQTPPYWEAFRKALYDELGDPNTADSVRLMKVSPLFHASKIKKPLMVLQGANDPRVLQVESDEIVAAVRKNNVPVEYVVFPDEGHGFRKKENEIKGYGQILVFLDKYLKGGGANGKAAKAF